MSTSDVRRVTLEFRMPLDDIRRLLDLDYSSAHAGITVESVAANMLRQHNPADGYIGWHIEEAP